MINILNRDKKETGQNILEFTFSMIVIFFMIYSMAMILRWVGLDMIERRQAGESSLVQSITEGYNDPEDGPLKQLDPYFYTSIPMNAVWSGD